MHLTNYSVNKYNVDYQISATNSDGEKSGSKRSLKFLFEYLRAQNLDGTTLWKDIQVGCGFETQNKTSFHLLAEYCDQNSLPCSASPLFCLSDVSSRCFAIQ